CELSIQKVCVVSLLYIYNFRVTCTSSKLVSLQMHIDELGVNTPGTPQTRTMALECLCGPYPPQVFLTHHGPIEITELPYPYHMNSCHLLMGGSLGAETSLRDSKVQETSPILLTKCLFIYLFQTVNLNRDR